MPGVRACLACTNKNVSNYMKERFGDGASLNTVSAELANPKRMQEFGYRRSPGPTMLATHIRKHVTPVAPVSSSLPSFTEPPGTSAPSDYVPPGDVASAIQKQALEMLAAGEMRLTAAHALRAQEMLDRRVERQKDREMQVLLARVLTRHSIPPPRYVGPEEDVVTIEGSAVEVAT